MKNYTVATEIKLTEKQFDKICLAVGGDEPPSAKISEVATDLIRNLADGGLMLPREAVDRIEIAINSIRPERIVESVETSANRKGERILLTYEIDPGNYPSLKEASESQGRPVEALMQECMAWQWVQGNLYAVPAEPPPLIITREDQEFLKKTLGVQTVFGTDVVRWIRELVEPQKEAASADLRVGV